MCASIGRVTRRSWPQITRLITWIKGTHTMKMGGNYQYASTFSLRNRARSGLFSFQTDFQTFIDQLLTGRIDEASRSFGDTSRHLYQPSMGLFFQDDWKVTQIGRA